MFYFYSDSLNTEERQIVICDYIWILHFFPDWTTADHRESFSSCCLRSCLTLTMACLNTPLTTRTLSRSAPCLLLWKTIWNGKVLFTSFQGIHFLCGMRTHTELSLTEKYIVMSLAALTGCWCYCQKVCFFDRMMWRVFSGFVSAVAFLAWLWFISICWTPSSPARFIKLSSDCEWTRNH